MIIDAHQHFWQYDPVKLSWITEEMAVLKQDFLPEQLKIVYESNGVDGCIAVQAEQSEEETAFLLKLAERNAFVRGVVGWVDLRSEKLEERLLYWRNFQRLCGFRHIVQDEPDVNFMLQDAFQRGIELLGKYGFTYDILVFPTQMKAALETVGNFPEQKFVLDHIAKPYIKAGKIEPWEKDIQAIAAYENVYCKVSGLVTEAEWTTWRYEQFIPYLNVVFDAFGTDRIMYGSDWPVCLLAGNYPEVKNILEQYTGNFSEEDKAKIWGRNAVEFYQVIADGQPDGGRPTANG